MLATKAPLTSFISSKMSLQVSKIYAISQEILLSQFTPAGSPEKKDTLLRARSKVMVTRGTVQNLTMRFMKITFVHGLNWTHVDAAVVAFFGIGYNMYNNKLRSL